MYKREGFCLASDEHFINRVSSIKKRAFVWLLMNISLTEYQVLEKGLLFGF